jgi:hypothetical protein
MPTLDGKSRYQLMVNFRVGNYTTGESLARRYNPKDQDFAPGAGRVLERHQCEGKEYRMLVYFILTKKSDYEKVYPPS